MDRQAARWVSILDDESLDEETGLPNYSDTAKDRIFNRLQAWLKERKRLFPEDKPKEGQGVTSMRDWMNSPEGEAALKAQIRKIQGEAPSAPGQPKAPKRDKTADQKKQAEGSALKALVFGGEGVTEDPPE